ncbi:gamma-glutamyltransferase, partial [Pseudomonadota bacterium]
MAIPGQTYRPTHGAVAAGHPRTAEAAVHALNEGGNAFDAVVAAHWCACISEPVLTSLGGGGFLLARAEGQAPTLYDFFAQTPLVKKPPDEIDFYPIQADFGTTQQEFHIGYGATATPGTVHGLFRIHRDLCKLPMKVLMEPAIDLAIRGVEINPLQAFIFDVVKPICLATENTAAQFSSQRQPSRLVSTGVPWSTPHRHTLRL